MKRSLYIRIPLTALIIALGFSGTFTAEPDITQKPMSNISAPDIQQVAPPICNQPIIPLYTVRSGDCLYGIAKTYNMPVSMLRKANSLEGTIIRVGQQLYVPVLSDNITGARIASIDQSLYPGERCKNNPLRIQLVKAGIDMLGNPYRRGGSRESGFDCSGLVKNLFSRFNIELPRSSRQQYKQGKEVDRDNLATGDLVFFSSSGKQPDHVGIYIGENKFIHAAIKAKKVIISDLNRTWYAVRFLGGRRIMDLWKDELDTDSQGT